MSTETSIPRSALILGLAGVIPFAWGALTLLMPALGQWGTGLLGARFVGAEVLVAYGIVIASFMSGVLWGFSTRATGIQATIGYGVSVLPALWVFFMVGNGFGSDPSSDSLNLIFGFLGILVLDGYCWWAKLTPRWWLKLRILLTALVVLCLAVAAFPDQISSMTLG